MNSSNDSRKLLKESYKWINTLFFLVMILSLAVVVTIILVTRTLTPTGLLEQLLTSLVGIIIPILLVNNFYDRMTKPYKDQEISEKLTETLMLNREILRQFNTVSKKQYIQNSTESILGEYEGSMLYTTLIEPYLNKKYNFRKNFRYYISYSERNPLTDTSQKIHFNEDDYYWVYEELSFFRTMNEFNIKSRSVSSGFSYKESTLEGLYFKECFFFRENLWVNDTHIDQLQGFTDDEMEHFVRTELNFKFELNDMLLPYKVSNDKSIEGFYLTFEIPNEIELDSKQEYKFKYTFRMPQLKTERKFLAVVSEPTRSVEIMFSHIQDKTKVVAIPFFENGDVMSTLPNGTIRIEEDGWVLPRAGVVFIWNEIESRQTNSTDSQLALLAP